MPILLSLPCLVARPVQAAAESSFRLRSEEPGILRRRRSVHHEPLSPRLPTANKLKRHPLPCPCRRRHDALAAQRGDRSRRAGAGAGIAGDDTGPHRLPSRASGSSAACLAHGQRARRCRHRRGQARAFGKQRRRPIYRRPLLARGEVRRLDRRRSRRHAKILRHRPPFHNRGRLGRHAAQAVRLGQGHFVPPVFFSLEGKAPLA